MSCKKNVFFILSILVIGMFSESRATTPLSQNERKEDTTKNFGDVFERKELEANKEQNRDEEFRQLREEVASTNKVCIIGFGLLTVIGLLDMNLRYREH